VGADRPRPTPRRLSARLQSDSATRRCFRTVEFFIPAAGDRRLAVDRHRRRVVRRRLRQRVLPQGRRNPRCKAGSDAVAENATRADRDEVLSTARVPPRSCPDAEMGRASPAKLHRIAPTPGSSPGQALTLPRQRGRERFIPLLNGKFGNQRPFKIEMLADLRRNPHVAGGFPVFLGPALSGARF
jgi:hypothetical protein